MSNTCDPLLAYPQVAICLRVWERASIQERLGSLPRLRLRAPKAASYNLRMASADFLVRRKATLRRSELSKWARIIKPATKVPFGFSASWFTPPDGPPRKLLTAEEAREGAAQEWSKLMVEPSCKWHHPVINQYKTNVVVLVAPSTLRLPVTPLQAIIFATPLWHTWDLPSPDTLSFIGHHHVRSDGYPNTLCRLRIASVRKKVACGS